MSLDLLDPVAEATVDLDSLYIPVDPVVSSVVAVALVFLVHTLVVYTVEKEDNLEYPGAFLIYHR